MTELTFKTNDFEGPLDLLLALVAKKKMSLFDIDLIALIDHYLEVIGGMQEHRLEVASEFIEMAAQLVYLKSLHLLPRSDEGERLERELTGRLVEYALCKQVSVQLGCISQGIFHVVRMPAEVELDSTYRIKHSIHELCHAHSVVMGKGVRRMPTEEQFDPIVTKPMVSVSSRIRHIVTSLRKKAGRLIDFFRHSEDRSESVATFLAVLELLHDGSIKIAKNGGVKFIGIKGDDVGR